MAITSTYKQAQSENSSLAATTVTTTTTTTTTATTATLTTTNSTRRPVVTAPPADGLSDHEIIAVSVSAGMIFIILTAGAILFFLRRRNVQRRRGQRLPVKSRDQQINMERNPPVLDLPLETYEVVNSNANSPTYHNYSGLNHNTMLDGDPRLRADSQSGLYENTQPQSNDPRSQSKEILVPKGWKPQLAKPYLPKKQSPLNPQNPKVTKQDSTENPYYITVHPDPLPDAPESYSVVEHKNQGQRNNYKNTDSPSNLKYKNKKQKQNQRIKENPKDSPPSWKPFTDRQESTMSANYYNINDDGSYQNVDMKLSK